MVTRATMTIDVDISNFEHPRFPGIKLVFLLWVAFSIPWSERFSIRAEFSDRLTAHRDLACQEVWLHQAHRMLSHV